MTRAFATTYMPCPKHNVRYCRISMMSSELELNLSTQICANKLHVETEEISRNHEEILSGIDKGLKLHRRFDGVTLTFEQQAANRYEQVAKKGKKIPSSTS